ncbi:Hypothetical predicted protein [Xyrichtys novacula]|uniref:Uncharacterized protein n=1 Tax=Xyrichtys novacula TaxID=13765 RepID=A0AAV1G107_XYRNO|nr:Hypothetical predicted protein [Xyrichtys novacula]
MESVQVTSRHFTSPKLVNMPGHNNELKQFRPWSLPDCKHLNPSSRSLPTTQCSPPRRNWRGSQDGFPCELLFHQQTLK